MPSAAAIQAKVNRGSAIGAAIVGETYGILRPVGVDLTAAQPFGTASVFISANDTFAGTKAQPFGKPLPYALFDRTSTLVGDYLTPPPAWPQVASPATRTFFIAAQQALKSTLVVECNAAVTLMRAAPAETGTAGFGATVRDANGGAQRSNEPAYLTGWPASVLQGTKGEGNPAGLPDDVRAPWVAVLLPVLPLGVTIQTGDQFTTDMGLTYTVSSAELTDLGWRLTAAYGMT